MQKYFQISQEERNYIYILLKEWYSKKEIALKLNRHKSTIYRELNRNCSLISKSFNSLNEDHKLKSLYHYLPDSAQNKRDIRRKQANYRTPLKNIYLFHYVIEKLKIGWSPDIISWVLRKNALEKYINTENRLIKQNTVSHETIYKFIYTKKWEELNLKQYLVRKHKRRRKYNWRKTQQSSKIPNQISILERKKYFPKLENRQEFWHFEWDSILSVRSTFSAIHTEVERKTRYIFAKKINKKSAENVEFATIEIFQNLPKNSVKSTTWDNWTEHTNHENVTKTLNIKIFFAEPYKSWQRWTNENANWIIRRFYPKWTNFDEITNDELQEIINKINNRPRKILNYKTSQEAWDEEIEKLEKINKK